MKPTSDCQTSHYHLNALIDARYRLVDFVGAGGMACVYKAREEGTPHKYAIKFLRATYHNEEYLVDFFRDEASSMRDLAHPNIVRFYRFVHTDVYSYIVMDFIEGFALSDVIKRMYKLGSEIPLDEVVRIMTQLARALDTIHREGYVHRDVKPSNVLIERLTGQTYLTDLGITTATNIRIEGAGTIAYMPPETAETGVADHRADIYSYGIMFYELLAKQRPFNPDPGLRGPAAESNLVNKHRQAPIPSITEQRDDLPEDLNAIMERALAKDPNDRYQDIIQLAADIHMALKPQLADDLQDFANITARRIDAPDLGNQAAPATASQQPLMLYVGAILAVAIVAVVLLLGSGLLSNSSTATSTSAPVTIANSPTPNPLTNQPEFAFLTGSAALAQDDTNNALRISAQPNAPLTDLRVGAVDGFALSLQLQNTDNIAQYGIAFRLQDQNNYLLFAIEPEQNTWQLSETVAGTRTTLETGTVDAAPQTVTVSGINTYFEVRLDDETYRFETNRFETGRLALWVEGPTSAVLELSALQIDLIGPDAEAARLNTPTPIPFSGNPRSLLRSDVQALLATNNPFDLAIDCPTYIALYNQLNRHFDSDDAEIRSLAQDTIDAGEVVFSICRSESPNSEYTFRSGIQDYNRWEQDLNGILQDIETDSS